MAERLTDEPGRPVEQATTSGVGTCLLRGCLGGRSHLGFRLRGHLRRRLAGDFLHGLGFSRQLERDSLRGLAFRGGRGLLIARGWLLD
jgi:hypothetical protein